MRNVLYLTTILRIHKAKQDDTAVVDVDGSFVDRKYMSQVNAEEKVAEPGPQPPSLTEWKLVIEDTFKDVALRIPLLTSGKVLYFNLCVLFFTNGVTPMYRFGVYFPCWACWEDW